MAGAKPVAWNGKMTMQRTNSAVERIPMLDSCGHAKGLCYVMQMKHTVRTELRNYCVQAL